MYTPKSFCFSNKTKQKELVTDTPSPNVRKVAKSLCNRGFEYFLKLIGKYEREQ